MLAPRFSVSGTFETVGRRDVRFTVYPGGSPAEQLYISYGRS